MVVNVADFGLGAGKRLLSSAYSHSDVAEKLSCSCSVITAKNPSNYTLPFISNRRVCSIKAVKESTDFVLDTSNREPFDKRFSESVDESSSDEEDKVEAILLLQKSFLEKQWAISAEKMMTFMAKENKSEGVQITCSGTSARKRRIDSRKKVSECKNPLVLINKRGRSTSSKKVLRNHLRSYVKGVASGELLTHAEVVQLSKKVKLGLYLEECRSRLKDRLGCEPTNEQFANSLRTSSADLQAAKMECNLAREKLAMSNVRLVMSIAQRYDNMGAEMADLVQGGLIGLLRGIEKFDPSKGFKISTYVFWWIRLGVTKALAENSRVVRFPNYLHERLSLIRNAKKKLEGKGITPSIDRIAESLNISEQKVQNASEAIIKVFSLDREAFPSLNGNPGETLHSYTADNHPENIPWHGVDEWALKAEVNNLMSATLEDREREIIRLYYGFDDEGLAWDDIGRRIGLSRERVRQIGHVALEKLKRAANRRNLEAMLIKH